MFENQGHPQAVSGESGPLRAWLENQQQAYVLALAVNDGVDLPWNGVITRLSVHEVLIHAVTSWHRISAGEGAKGTRWYDWALVPLAKPKANWGHWLLVRRSLQEPDTLAAYLVFAPEDTLLETMVAVAARSWTVEECLELGKGEVGLAQYEVRRWTGWYRYITLSTVALAYLAVMRTHACEEAEKKGH